MGSASGEADQQQWNKLEEEEAVIILSEAS